MLFECSNWLPKKRSPVCFSSNTTDIVLQFSCGTVNAHWRQDEAAGSYGVWQLARFTCCICSAYCCLLQSWKMLQQGFYQVCCERQAFCEFYQGNKIVKRLGGMSDKIKPDTLFKCAASVYSEKHKMKEQQHSTSFSHGKSILMFFWSLLWDLGISCDYACSDSFRIVLVR